MTASSRILSCSLTPCLLFSLSRMAQLTFAPSSYTILSTACVLCQTTRVVLQRVPAHVGIAESETADRPAKTVAKLPQPHLSTSYKEVKTLLKQKQKSAWRLKNNGWGRNSSVGSAWVRCPQRRGLILLWGHFPVEGIFPLELTWVQTPFPEKLFWMRV